MPDALIVVTGIEETLAKLQRLGKLDTMRAVMLAAAEHVKGVVDKYPPATIANSPQNPTGKWYERGYGPKWRTKDGGVHGRKTSKMLGRQWTVAAIGNFESVVGNNVPYGPYVQDETEQASFHKAHGWKTVQQVAREEADTVTRFIVAEIGRQIEGF